MSYEDLVPESGAITRGGSKRVGSDAVSGLRGREGRVSRLR